MISQPRKKQPYMKYIPPLQQKIDSSINTDISLNNYLEEISEYANKIYTDLHVPETVVINTKEDYIKLFIVACKIAKQAKDVIMSIDVSIFGDFGNVADKLHDIFQNYIFRIKSMDNMDNNIDFLKSIVVSLKKIWIIKETFSKFKEAILSVSLDTNDDIITSIEIIEDSIKKIQNWNNLYTTGMNIEISNKPSPFVENANKIIKNTSNIIEDAVSIFHDKPKLKQKPIK